MQKRGAINRYSSLSLKKFHGESALRAAFLRPRRLEKMHDNVKKLLRCTCHSRETIEKKMEWFGRELAWASVKRGIELGRERVQ